MIVSVDASSGSIELLAPDDFKALSISLAGGSPGDAAAALGGRTDGDHVWIPAERLRALGRPDDDGWSASFDAMLEKVKPYGYVDPVSGDVRAHVVVA
jgi:hypothetical protein